MTMDTTARPTASIVMPCYNVGDTLNDQLERLLPQIDLTGAELVLIDNNSTDDTPELLEAVKHRSNVTVGSATRAQGAAYARNHGVALARSDKLLFCDADDLVSPQWVETMSNALASSPVVTGMLDVTELNTDVQQAGRGTGNGPASFYGLFPIAHAGNMGVTRSAWNAIGPLDETLTTGEDMEWSLRAKTSGHNIVRADDGVVHYRYRQTAKALWRQGFLYGQFRPEIARRVNESLGERVPRIAGARSWAWLALNSPRAIRRELRPQLAWVAGNRLGHIVGSIRARFMVL